MFAPQEISKIQQLQQFFNLQMETQFIAGRINQLRDANDIAGAHNFATYLETEIRKGIATITALTQKDHRLGWAVPGWEQRSSAELLRSLEQHPAQSTLRKSPGPRSVGSGGALMVRYSNWEIRIDSELALLK
jgi:hypothetical protein